MRTTADRIRYAISFEIIALILVMPLGALAFDKPVHDMGVIAVVGATLATLWNYVYNLMFDHAMLALRGSVEKTLAIRVLHALLFELGLLTVLLPFVAWYLRIGLWEALILDLALAGFYMVYAFVFAWAYDRIFPIAPVRG